MEFIDRRKKAIPCSRVQSTYKSKVQVPVLVPALAHGLVSSPLFVVGDIGPFFLTCVATSRKKKCGGHRTMGTSVRESVERGVEAKHPVQYLLRHSSLVTPLEVRRIITTQHYLRTSTIILLQTCNLLPSDTAYIAAAHGKIIMLSQRES